MWSVTTQLPVPSQLLVILSLEKLDCSFCRFVLKTPDRTGTTVSLATELDKQFSEVGQQLVVLHYEVGESIVRMLMMEGGEWWPGRYTVTVSVR